MYKIILMVIGAVFTIEAQASDCTKAQAQEAVEKICSIIEKKGDAGLSEVQQFRYCGANYVWVQDSDVKMVMHPIKVRLNGKSLKKHQDEKGKKLFVEFDKMAKAKAAGGWVDYLWPRPGAEKATPKTSFVKKCGGGKSWIAGSGIWK